MPKIGKYNYRHSKGNINLDYEIHFGYMKYSDGVPHEVTQEKYFYIRLPEHLIIFFKKRVIYNKNHDALEKAFEKMADKYYDQSITEKKTIALKFDYKHFGEKEPAYNSKEYGIIRTQKYNGTMPEIQIEMSYTVGYLVTIGDRSFFSITGKDGELHEVGKAGREYNSSYRNEYYECKFIEWTKEREVWVVNTYNSFNAMIIKCRQFFEQKQEKITDIIDQKNMFLLPNN